MLILMLRLPLLPAAVWLVSRHHQRGSFETLASRDNHISD